MIFVCFSPKKYLPVLMLFPYLIHILDIRIQNAVSVLLKIEVAFFNINNNWFKDSRHFSISCNRRFIVLISFCKHQNMVRRGGSVFPPYCGQNQLVPVLPPNCTTITHTQMTQALTINTGRKVLNEEVFACCAWWESYIYIYLYLYVYTWPNVFPICFIFKWLIWFGCSIIYLEEGL